METAEEKLEQKRKRAREASKRYRLKNKEKISRYNKRYSKTHREQENAKAARYRAKHREEINARAQAAYQKNPEKMREISRRHYYKNRDVLLERMRIYREENRDKINAQKRKRYVEIRTKVFSHYGWSCECCDERLSEFLTIDHINGDGSEHRKQIGQGQLYAWLIKNKFPEGFRTLCMNCNFARGHHGYCPHQKEI